MPARGRAQPPAGAASISACVRSCRRGPAPRRRRRSGGDRLRRGDAAICRGRRPCRPAGGRRRGRPASRPSVRASRRSMLPPPGRPARRCGAGQARARRRLRHAPMLLAGDRGRPRAARAVRGRRHDGRAWDELDARAAAAGSATATATCGWSTCCCARGSPLSTAIEFDPACGGSTWPPISDSLVMELHAAAAPTSPARSCGATATRAAIRRRSPARVLRRLPRRVRAKVALLRPGSSRRRTAARAGGGTRARLLALADRLLWAAREPA